MAYQINIANREINPRVINFFTFENQVTTLEFTLDSYMYDEIDLRNYKAYAVTSLKGLVDLTELEMTYDDVDDKLILTWNVGDYTLTQEGAIVYQITFKQNEDDGEDSAAWYSYKAIMINRGSVDADHKIVAEYPTIMSQWLKKMDDLYSEVVGVQEELEEYAIKFTNSIFYIPYGEAIPVEERIDGRLYYQWTDADKTKGRFEDPDGVHLVPEAKAGLPMFAPIWSDHLYNDASYLRADNFSWHTESIYVSAYEKLLKEYNNEASVEEVEKGVTYKLSPNGFKIADASQEEAINELYLSDEKAWYYILDTENSRFKLPREKKVDGKYLYFFIGAYELEETEVDLGKMTEVINEMNAKTDRLLEEMVDDLEEAKNNAIAEINEHSMINNVGDIFYTTRLDTELHGAVECNGGTYNTEDYTGEQSVGNLLANGSLPYVSLEEYESLVTTNGSCRAFGWSGGAEFRVPTLSGLMLTKEQAAVVGNGMSLGLTNGTNNAGLVIRYDNTDGSRLGGNIPSYGSSVGTTASNSGYTNELMSLGITTDPTKSGIVANLDVIEYRAMIVLATGVKEVSIQDYTRQLTETTNRQIAKITQAGEIELSKITQAGLEGLQAEVNNLKAEINTMLGRMDFANAAEVRLDTTTTSYTVPSDGYIQFSTTNANSGAIYINGNSFCHITSVSNGNAGLIPVAADDVLSTNIEEGWVYMTFIPQKGV